MTAVLTMILSFVIVALAIAGMAVGVMARRPPLKGSCGGLNGHGCELCSGVCERRSGSRG